MREISAGTFAIVLKRCAQEMNLEEQRRVDSGEVRSRWRGICGEWSTKGRTICNTVATDAGLPEYGEVFYYLLGGAWNDSLDWADRIEKLPGS